MSRSTTTRAAAVSAARSSELSADPAAPRRVLTLEEFEALDALEAMEGPAMRWEGLLEDVSHPSIDRDGEGACDVLPTCCLAGILGAFGSFVLFGSVAVPVLAAAAVGGLVGLVVARA